MEECFRWYYERAVRVEGNIDWSVHSIDYHLFKKRLTFFKQRRARLRKLLEVDGWVAENVVAAIIGPKSHHRQGINEGYGGYIEFTESSNSMSSSAASAEHIIAAGPNAGKRLKERRILRRISNAERNEVTMFLTFETDKVAMFYLGRWSHLSQVLVEQGPSEHLGNEILELLAFCTCNILAIRQSLIRYDAFARTFGGTPLMHWFKKKMMIASQNHNSLCKILHHEELNALAHTFCVEYNGPLEKFRTQWLMFQELLDSSERKEFLASTGQVLLRDTFVQQIRHYFLLGAIEDRLALEPTFLTQRGRSLTPEIKVIDVWRKKRVAVLRQHDEAGSHRLSPWECFALALNILSAFLYCMNYYIVEPSSALYAEALGAPTYVAATLIGMMPLAAMMSAVVYAIWTNRSFKEPLVLATILMITGNILYAIAYNYKSIWMALIGRFLTGLGGPKCIIRRYIADTTPLNRRTSANAAFSMSIAVGSALGPASAILLNQFNFVSSTPIGYFTVNGMTGPGYFMAAVWTVFLLVVLLGFGEPDRAGLEEQQRMEAQRAAATELDVMTEPDDDENKQRIIEMVPSRPKPRPRPDDDLQTILSGDYELRDDESTESKPWYRRLRDFFGLVTPPVRLCLGLLYAKTFTIEALVSCTSTLTRHRYGWAVTQVGVLGCVNGLLVVPLSILVGYLSTYYQDRTLMTCLVAVGCLGMFLLIDISDLQDTPTLNYNEGDRLAVDPVRYVSGYFIAYCSIQSFEGVIGSALSKVIPTALASGTFNSGLLATLVDTLGRACGDLFISMMGYVNLRQLMNLLFIPAFTILLSCLIAIRRFSDVLAV